ncbi:Transposon TX1 uncharacterized, partial [Smittium culicis]
KETLRSNGPDLALDELFSSLVDSVWAQSAQLGAVTAPEECFKTILSKKTLKKVKKRRKKFKKTVIKKGPIREYLDAKSKSNESIKADRKAHYEKTQKKLAEDLLSNSSKEYWRYIESCTGNTFHSISNDPVIRNKNFCDLAKDASGNFRSAAKWRELLSDDADYFPECDDSVKWSEITKVLNEASNYKAPGVDEGNFTHIYDNKATSQDRGIQTDSQRTSRKAYDRVPHMAMIHKLRSISIGGKLLNVINGMYYDPKIAVRIGEDISEPSDHRYGVLQGCPDSPILFDLYINDIFSRVLGVDVPGLPNRIPGLLFADDAVVLVDSAENLQTSSDTISAWSDACEVAVNASKCTIMTINCDDAVEMTLKRQTIRTIDNYTYLGYIMNSKWGVSGIIKKQQSEDTESLILWIRLSKPTQCAHRTKNKIYKFCSDIYWVLRRHKIWNERGLISPNTDCDWIGNATGSQGGKKHCYGTDPRGTGYHLNVSQYQYRLLVSFHQVFGIQNVDCRSHQKANQGSKINVGNCQLKVDKKMLPDRRC